MTTIKFRELLDKNKFIGYARNKHFDGEMNDGCCKQIDIEMRYEESGSVHEEASFISELWLSGLYFSAFAQMCDHIARDLSVCAKDFNGIELVLNVHSSQIYLPDQNAVLVKVCHAIKPMRMKLQLSGVENILNPSLFRRKLGQLANIGIEFTCETKVHCKQSEAACAICHEHISQPKRVRMPVNAVPKEQPSSAPMKCVPIKDIQLLL